MHGIQQATGSIRVFRDGIVREEPPLIKLEIDYPGVGPRPVWTFGHPESLTFPKYYPDLKSSLNVTFASPSEILSMQCLRWLVDHHLLSATRAAAIFEWYERRRKQKDPTKLLQEGLLPPVFGAARGKKDGKPAWVGVAQTGFAGGMGEITGVPMAVTLQLLAKDQITKRGVFAPEGCIDPDAFFETLVPYCGEFASKPEDIYTITRSWDPGPQDLFAAAANRTHGI